MLEDRVQRELERAARAYAQRDADPASAARYDPLRSVNLFRSQQRDWAIARLLRRNGVRSLAGLDILEVGCGSGGILERLVGLGAEERRLTGLDLSEARIDDARRRLPGADLRVGSAHALPFPAASFDIVAQFTLFSSVVDPAVREAIAREMQRVLRPAGHVLWYEAHRARPTPDFVPVPDSELRALFPGWRITRASTTLRWWLIERVVPRSRLAAQLMELVPYLCSHTVAVLQRD